MQPITVYFPGLESTFGPFNSPLSTEKSIVFPFNLSSKEFSRGAYSAKLTQGRASVGDINQFLTLVELVLSRLGTTTGLIIRFLLRMVIPFLFYIFLWDSYWPRRGALEIVGAIYFFYLAPTIAAMIVDRSIQKENAENDIQKIIEMMRPAFAKRGLSWHLSDEYFCCWLELRKDEDQTDDQESLVGNVTQDQTMSNQSVHGGILENFKSEENFKYTPIPTYEPTHTGGGQ